ncbi:MAG: [FeFe] hydrogenase H-cluster radical SAM maturase HydE [Firmicutes bacterium]|nr:[FeFe] hydrogenase H-cluster radical SAM maturase HydE [Bacillota bacterium]
MGVEEVIGDAYGTGTRFWDALGRARAGKDLTRDEIRALLQAEPGDQTWTLFSLADEVRARYVGDEVHLRGLVEFSSYCARNCAYCGLRRDNRKLRRYRIAPDEIVDIAEYGATLGYKTIVLQSGDDFWYSADALASIITRIKNSADVAVTVCIGERSREEYATIREAGADRFLLKHETADPELYRDLHPGMTLEERVMRLRWLKELGFQVGSGNIVGLPGQTIDSLAGDIVLMRDLGVDMAGIGPFIPHPDTPLAGSPQGPLELVLKVVACTRLALPWAHIPATTAAGTVDPRGREKALQCGANVVMPNITPVEYRKLYQIYPNKICLSERADSCRRCIENRIKGIGRSIGTGYGHCREYELA